MTPRLASRYTESVSSPVDAPRDPARCRWFAIVLFTAGIVFGVALIASGQQLPSFGYVLLFAVLLAFAVNRFVLFPSEIAVTAEAAVLLAAIVALRDNGPLVGPWFVAFLAGPLDVVHWRRRSFVRMAFNAGNRMAATLAGATTFAIVIHAASLTFGHGAGSSLEALAGAAVGASIAFALVEGVVGTVLVRLRDAGFPFRHGAGFPFGHGAGPWLDAARIELPMELLTVPLGMIGAFAGYLATQVGWWCAVAVLTPTLFLPELALIRWRRVHLPFGHGAGFRFGHGAGAAKNLAATIGPAAAVLTAVALLVPLPPVSTLVALGAVALVAGLELRVDDSAPPAVATLVGAAVVVSGGTTAAAAALVAVVAVATACVVARANRWWTPVLAGAAALGASAVYDVHPSRTFALGAALIFELLVVARLAKVARFSGVVWTAPLVCVAVTLAYVWRAIGPFGAVVFVVGMVATLVVTAFFGAPPWGSRVVGPWAARHRTRAQRAVLVVAAVLSLSLGFAAGAVGDERVVLVAAGAAAAAAVATMAMTGVRQWRFAPRSRARDAVLVLASAVTAVVAYPPLALHGSEWSLAILAGSLALSTPIAWPLARLAAVADPVRGSSGPEVVNH